MVSPWLSGDPAVFFEMEGDFGVQGEELGFIKARRIDAMPSNFNSERVLGVE